MKTEAQLARTEMELRAVDDARSMMRYLQFGPVTNFHPYGNTWKQHCDELEHFLLDALHRGEFWMNNPDYKLG